MVTYDIYYVLFTVVMLILAFYDIIKLDRIEANQKKLLKSQTDPQRPKDLRLWHEGYVGDCPVCGRVVQFAQKHCHNCTQLLDWQEVLDLPSEEDDE